MNFNFLSGLHIVDYGSLLSKSNESTNAALSIYKNIVIPCLTRNTEVCAKV